jgi:hypothetical protein
MAEGPERLIVEHLDDETLVYDTERHEAHTLSGAGAAEFLAAEDEISRRQVLRKLALAGAAAAGTGALVRTIVAPTPTMAQSLGQPCGVGGVCNPGLICFGGFCVADCNPACAVGEQCCHTGGGPFCAPSSNTCCANTSCDGLTQFCCDNQTCCSNGVPCCGSICCTTPQCCNGNTVCCGPGTVCTGGNTCSLPSNRNLKHHLAPVDSQDVLVALGL